MDKLHGKTDFTQIAAASWNIFRYVGDYLHLIGIFILLVTIGKNKSVAGISRTTQYLYLAVFATRYLDLFEFHSSLYLVCFKLTYLATGVFTLVLFHQLDSTYDRRNDSCHIGILVFPCIVGALVLTSNYQPLEVLWTFSEFLEAFAMVPQYVYCYRERLSKNFGATAYVLALGGYRVFYAMNWIYKKFTMPQYSDIQSWIGGVIEIGFFVDFLAYRFSGSSLLRSAVLTVDTKINEISDTIELNILGTSSVKRMEAREAGSAGGEMRRRQKPAGGDDV